MAKFTLSVETEEVVELRDILNKIAGDAPVAAPKAEEQQAAAPVAEKPKAAPKARKVDAAPLSLSPAPDVSKSHTGAAAETGTTADIATTLGEKISQAAPADVTYDQVKQALIALMDLKSASVVQGLLKDKFGVPAISQLDKARYGEAYAALTEWAA